MKKLFKTNLDLSLLISLGMTLCLLTFTGCSSGGGSSVTPLAEEDIPEDNKGANYMLTLVPEGGDNYLLIVGITDAIPGSQVKQSNAQNTLFGSINAAGVYQKEHAVYPGGSGEITVIVTVTDPEGEVLIKALEQEIPAKELDLVLEI